MSISPMSNMQIGQNSGSDLPSSLNISDLTSPLDQLAGKVENALIEKNAPANGPAEILSAQDITLMIQQMLGRPVAGTKISEVV